jgi:hypothetical protein
VIPNSKPVKEATHLSFPHREAFDPIYQLNPRHQENKGLKKNQQRKRPASQFRFGSTKGGSWRPQELGRPDPGAPRRLCIPQRIVIAGKGY